MNEQIQPPQGAPLFNPGTPAFIADPYSFYHRLRATDPMHLTPPGSYVASRHADVAAILRDKRFGRNFIGGRSVLMLNEPVFRSMSHWILLRDPPDHGRLRNLVVRAFTARRVEDMRPRIQQIVDEIIDRLEPQGHMDLIADFAFGLPVTVICDILGIPKEDHQVFFTSSRARFGRLLDLVPLSRAELDQQNSYNLAMAEYFGRLFELRRREPGDDLTTYLVQAEENDRLTNEELTANVILLFLAGLDTTVNLIGNGLLALHRNPDQLRLLKNDPSLMANAIEELLRYDASVQATSRTALEYVDEIGGISLEKGRSVICLLGSANRDPAVYSDPDRLDVTRPDVRPLSFGGGIHHCVGAQLARMEGEIAIATLLRRLPDLQLDDVDHPDWRQTFVLRGLNKLLASW
jgi:cytochrome P450